ncbi:helix-turn-helix domain-containing protein [Dysgonomonas sp. 25]|uniref:winged helix-turn-helix transcriptional regulator n=1 Tax=Dysgonomonas sp. 25 TaxID=2302933 RepID=UPI0013D5D62F|nr:helix-turn-helix domain-containing protein [Dysgonomonas sp. 25]NDV69308.1 transcriptional regulator [Dysgonomonas sp. 25]
MENFLPSGNCPIRQVLNRIGDKWSMLVLATLQANEVMRFSDIHRSIGDISHRMLTVTLRMLEADGLLHRKVYPQVPPRVEYTLTDMGHSLIPHLRALVDWAAHNMPQIMEAREDVKG